MSELTAAVPAPSTNAPSTTGPVLSTPEFDRQEISGFGRDDGHAIGVIGKMLVLFFLYSALAMGGVALWTLAGFGQSAPATAHGHHSDDTADF